ncbi:hypothetical protein JRO89_XSUnG0016600 [Xanthoceras sorbifolium]|uniref:Cytochrome P450 n=1 Tax=Xanthoceras sorbifolium TaxID=99658 RepID=A0ABQ8H0C8_9ROSI|nr:hypothetical protein JRO89_XSUnG0016600 [Xanthoceras sorbifolium]
MVSSVDTMNSYISLLFISVMSLLIVLWLIKSTFTKSQSNLRFPPSPPALPIIGHLHLLSSQLPKSLQTLACRYGPLMQIRMGASTCIVVSNATVAKDILKTHEIDFASRYESGPGQYNIYSGCGFITGPYGAYWRFMKKLCATKLFAQLQRFEHIREKEIEKLLKSLLKSSRKGEPCNLGKEFATLTNNLTFRMTMGKKFSENGDEAVEMRRLAVEIMEIAAKFGVNEVFGFLKKVDLFGNGKKLRETICKYDEFVEQIMKEYEDNEINGRENDEDKDPMEILLETYRDTNSEVKLTRYQIKYFLLEIFLASVDSTSAALQWAMAELINHPRVFNKLKDEINSVVGEDIDENNIGQTLMEMRGQDFRYIPFGGGRRGCSGATHAYLVMEATIGALVQCFDWKVKGGEKIDIDVGSGYSGAMAIRMGDTPFVIVSDANTAEKVLKTHDIDFASKYEPGPSQKLLYKGCSFINAPYSLYWRFMKKICVTKLFTSAQLHRFTHVREEERTRLLKSLMKRSEDGELCDLSKELEALTSLMIYRMTMGNRISSSGDYSVQAMEMRGLIRNIMECGKKYPVIEVFGPLRRFDLFGNGKRIESAFLGYDKKLEQIIQEYEQNRIMKTNGENEEKDVMDILLETCTDSNAEVKITKSHIKYFFMVPHASYVIHTTVAALVQCFDWKLEDGDKAGIDIVSGYTGAMAHPLVCYPIVNFNPFKA